MITFPHIQRVLAISPHADDMELGCGGTIAQAINQGIEVYSLVLSLRRKTLAADFPEEEMYNEIYAAHDTLGISRDKLLLADFEHRIFPTIRQELLDYLVTISKQIKPQMVLLPSFDDMHQDHIVIAQEAFRAFKDTNLLSYELPWNRIKTTLNSYVVLKESDIQKKVDALQCYKSQIKWSLKKPNSTSYLAPDYIRSLAVARGGAIKQQYAEGFEIVRLID